MFAFFRTASSVRLLPCTSRTVALLGALCMISMTRAACAQGTHLWTQSQLDEFEKGTPQGVELSSDGHLRQGPGLTEVATTPSTFVWSVAADKNGTAYVGTGAPATVLRIGAQKGEKPFTLLKTKDLTVQVVRLGPDGFLYAATLPSGRVYKLKPDASEEQNDSNATVVFDAGKLDAAQAGSGATESEKSSAKPHYIWDLTFDSVGRLYIATGGPGAVYRVDPSKPGAAPEAFFKTDEAHIRALAWAKNGDLLAGSDGSGLVYRISPAGKGYVLFDSPRREVTSLAVAPNGTIYAACVGDKGHNPLPPLPVQGVGSVTITVVQPGSLQAVNQSTSIPEGTEIDALADNQAPRKIWADKDDIVYALAMRKDGLLALTGNRGRLFRIEDDGSYADIGHLDAQQGLSLAEVGDEALIGTGNTGKLIRLGSIATHEYASDVLDTGNFARFGRIEIEPGSNGYELFTRTGNIDQPVRGWSDWQPLNDGAVASPPGRFLQWKAELRNGGTLGSVGVNYLPVNTAPVVDDLVVVPGARLNAQSTPSAQQTLNISFPSSGQGTVTFDTSSSSSPLQAVKDHSAITARWAAHDDDGDDLIYSLYLRGDGETAWHLLKDKVTDKAYSFDAALIPDGGYQLKIVASDAPSEPPSDVLTASKVSDRFVVDTTAPVLSNLKATAQSAPCKTESCTRSFAITLDAEDATSPIAHAEYSVDAGPFQYVDPVGKISDSQHEHYDFKISVAETAGRSAEHLITVRVYDRYDNAGIAKTVIPAQE
jgi:WD domain, G-beta repeat